MQVGQQVARGGVLHEHAVADAGRVGDGAQATAFGGVAFVAADNPEDGLRVAVEARERFDQQVDALERFEAADEEDRRLVGDAQVGQLAADRGPRGLAVAGMEALEVDAAGGGADAAGVGLVEVDQEVALVRGPGDQQVRAGGNVMLAGDADGRLAAVGVTIVAVLDLAEGVEGGGVGTAPALSQRDAAEAGDPIVRVEDFVGPAVTARDVVGARGEGVDVRGNFDRRERGGRADVDVDDLSARGDLDDIGEVGTVAAGVDVDDAITRGELFGRARRRTRSCRRPWWCRGEPAAMCGWR